MIDIAIIIVSLFVLVIAAYTDLRTLEVPDWLNYSGIAAGLGISIIYSAQQWSYWPIVWSSLGLLIGFAIASLMYYGGQWGGGDAKLLMAIGAILGFHPDKFAISTGFLINLVFAGAAWSLIWSGALAIGNRKNFWKTFKALRHHSPYKRLRITSLLVAAVLVFASFALPFKTALLGLALIAYAMCYLTIFVKSVELSCMHKWITPDKLTEGDWLIHAVKVGNKQVLPAKLGLEKKQVNLLNKLYAQKKIDRVLVKYGVPFTPAFLMAFVFTIIYGNIILAAFF